MRAELCRRSEGSTGSAGLGWTLRSAILAWLGWDVSLQSSRRRKPLHEGQRCSLDTTWSTTATGQDWRGRRKESRPPI